MKKYLFLIVVFHFFLVKAQNTNPNKNLNFNISFLGEDPIIDGEVLNETLWEQVYTIRDLKQIKPDYGAPASEKTAIKIAYTAKTLYVAVVCFDTSPEKIVVSDSRRDADLNDDDSFLFIIDTYNDQQNGFLYEPYPTELRNVLYKILNYDLETVSKNAVEFISKNFAIDVVTKKELETYFSL